MKRALAILAIVPALPVAWWAWRLGKPQDISRMRAQIRAGWLVASSAWMWQLYLVAGVAPIVRGAPERVGAAMVKAIVPVTVAIAAIVLGLFAGVVPGLVLLVLLVHTGASEQLGQPLPAALRDSIAAVRAQWKLVAVVVGAMIGVDLAIAGAAHLAVIHRLPRQAPVALMVQSRTFVRIVGAGLAVWSLIPAVVLARLRVRSR